MKRLHTTNQEFIDLNKKYNQPTIYPVFKPEGLYYGINNAWLNWFSNNIPEKAGKYTFELDIDTNSLYRIETIKDLLNLIERYEMRLDPFTGINWQKLSEDYSGIEIENYHKINFKFRNIKHTWFLAWDVDSGCIWDLSKIKKTKILKKWLKL